MIRCSPFACFVLFAGAAFAQSSELFLTDYGDTNVYVVQNGQIVRQFSRSSSTDGPALVVQATVKLYGQDNGNVGREYALNGTPLAGQYTNTGFVDCYDGATDGASNWTISHNDFSNNFAVLVGDANWGNVQIAFVPNRRSSGIAYDATDGTLWISNNSGGSDRVQHYTTSGTMLGEFPVGLSSGGGYGIALDPSDQTLWLPGAFGTAGQLHQYDKTGNLLQVVTVPGLTANVLGAEFGGGSGAVLLSYCTSSTTSAGCAPSITGTGTPSASNPSGFTIAISAVEGQKQGLILYGIDNTGFTPLPWASGSTSFLCVKPPTQRTPLQSSGGTAGQCDGALALDWNAFRAANPTALGVPFSPGQHIFAQGWFRDAPAPKTTNLSNALEFSLLP